MACTEHPILLLNTCVPKYTWALIIYVLLSDYYHPPVKREMAGLFNTVPLAEANQYHNGSFTEQVIIRFTKHSYAPVITASEEMFIEQDNNVSKAWFRADHPLLLPAATVINWTKFHFFPSGSTALLTCEATPPITSKTWLCSDHYCLRRNVLWAGQCRLKTCCVLIIHYYSSGRYTGQ